ncbi:MAG: 23S rRNA (uracil(1939)-C(5))-methyltransferase RlmD [Lachnospiraceae bacterium]|nr:23S rRNA (uracil(1939)-C(5))-methyltransferase RlmD [Lachnospiraceae bacterium]
MQFEKNQTVELTIEDLSENGEGIGRTEGYTLFVKDAVTGDRVRAKIVKLKKSYGYAITQEIIKPSPDRVIPACENHRSCGGCQIQALKYEAQLRYKMKKVTDDLVRIGGFERDHIEKIMEPIAGMDEPCRYRNKTQFPVGQDKNGNIISGFYAKRTHDIIKTEDCLIGIKENKIIIDTILKHMEKYGIRPYDEKTSKGIVRHVIIRKGFKTGDIMICLVINISKNKTGFNEKTELLFEQAELVEKLRAVEGVKSIVLNINNKNTNVILGDEDVVIYGTSAIHDTLLGIDYEISAHAFYQVNPLQTEKLYQTVAEFAALSGTEEVWDICCGIGTIALTLSKDAATVHGLEIVPEAIDDAKRNAVLNNVTNADFICAPCEEYLPAHRDRIRADVVVMDPPRKGMDEKALEVVVSVSPRRIIYVSCDPATLARDLRYLSNNGYYPDRIRSVDMFPHTTHVETVVLLSKGDINSRKVRVEFSLEDMDTSGFQQGATYDAIRDWVMKKYGFRVSNLSIAQVKQKHGIIERENYNKPKSPDSKQPGTSEMRIKAIEDSLRYFQMI